MRVGGCVRFRNWVAVFVEGFEMEADSFADQFFHHLADEEVAGGVDTAFGTVIHGICGISRIKRI